MERLLQVFDTPFTDPDGNVYDVLLYGQSRPADTWQGWLAFRRRNDLAEIATGVETTQPSAEAVLYWATGLSATYFDGAFARARDQVRTTPAAVPTPPPLRDVKADRETYVERLTELERDILEVFRRRAAGRLSTEVLFHELPHAHADVVRALEDLQKRRGVVLRSTEGGNDWVTVLSDPG